MESTLPKFLVKARYTAPNGVKGLIADGGSARFDAVKALVESVGGTVESFYYAFGDVDAYLIMDVPDLAAGMAVVLTVNASGLATIEIEPLISPAELDEAAKKSPVYDAPGPDA